MLLDKSSGAVQMADFRDADVLHFLWIPRRWEGKLPRDSS